MDDIEVIGKVMAKKGYFVMRKLPTHCPVCAKKYLERDLPRAGVMVRVCLFCNHHEDFVPVDNGRFVTDGQLRTVGKYA